ERPGNPYADDTIAGPAASAIAAMASRNFLIAGLIARSRGLHDSEAADPSQLAFSATVDSALAAYLERLSPAAGLPADRALTALAFAEAPGLPARLWQLAIEAIDGTHVAAEDLTRFARSSAANFLVETGGETAAGDHGPRGSIVYRLFHQALNDALLRARAEVMPRADDEHALTLAFTRHGRRSRWKDVPPYLLRSLPAHAAAAGLADDLLRDDDYLLHADLRRLIQSADGARSAPGRRRAQLLRLTPRAITAGPRDRAGLFSVTEALDDLGTSYRDGGWQAPYRALWASVKPRSERATLEGHQGWLTGMCPLTVAGKQLLASAGTDGTVRVWDPQTGEQRTMMEGHEGVVNGICPVTAAGRELLASAGGDGTVRIWDPQTGRQRTMMEADGSVLWSVCPVTVAGKQLLASASEDGTVRIWDPQTGQQRATLAGHHGGVWSVCPVTAAGKELLASAGRDGTVRIWDPQTGQQRTTLEGHQREVNGVCPVTMAGKQLLASAGSDRTVRIWDPQTGACPLIIPTFYPGEAIAWVAQSLAIGLGAGILMIKPRTAG
ncbi:MAG TPA: WD40 repeat domain-containing protein, partial [Streptosporangiaceae bacterium]|nr:WD40 repeat domain-containing protein [Streptosporangiaceae bacterium]